MTNTVSTIEAQQAAIHQSLPQQDVYIQFPNISADQLELGDLKTVVWRLGLRTGTTRSEQGEGRGGGGRMMRSDHLEYHTARYRYVQHEQQQQQQQQQ